METENKPLLEAMDITPSKDGGVMKCILKEGIGTELPEDGDEVFVDYHGTFEDGEEFDTNIGRGDHFTFTLGKGSVIKGWEIGVASMRKGEKAVLTCKPEYAYGAAGSGKIPPNATLKFEVELFYWKCEDLSPNKDQGIIRHYIERGKGFQTPAEGSTVEVHLLGKYGDKVFEDKEVSFTVGDGEEYGICSGIDTAVASCKKGDKVKLNITSRYAFGSEGRPDLGIPPDSAVEYEVTLKNVETAKEEWELNIHEKFTQCDMFKEKGTKNFKKENYQLAIKQYKKIVDYLQTDTASLEPEEDQRKKQLLLAGNLNLSACYLKLNEYVNAKDSAEKALLYDKENEKALFRRGQALLALHEPQQAKCDFSAILNINPTNKAAVNQVNLCNAAIRSQKEHDKKLYANMFDKFAKIDKQREDAHLAKQPDCLINPGEWENTNEEPEIISSNINEYNSEQEKLLQSEKESREKEKMKEEVKEDKVSMAAA